GRMGARQLTEQEVGAVNGALKVAHTLTPCFIDKKQQLINGNKAIGECGTSIHPARGAMRRDLRCMRPKSEEAIAMKLIVLAPEDDNHTAPIKWALEKAGHRVVCWAGLSWTEDGQASLLMNQDDTLVLGGHSVDP